MPKSSIRTRLEKLEDRGRFLDWFVGARFFDFLTDDELQHFSRYGELSVPISNRASRLDHEDRKTLLQLWHEDERKFNGRSSGYGELRYSTQNGSLVAEWIAKPEE